MTMLNAYIQLEINDSTHTTTSSSYLDLYLEIVRTKLLVCNKREDFLFPFVNFLITCNKHTKSNCIWSIHVYPSVHSIFQSLVLSGFLSQRITDNKEDTKPKGSQLVTHRFESVMFAINYKCTRFTVTNICITYYHGDLFFLVIITIPSYCPLVLLVT